MSESVTNLVMNQTGDDVMPGPTEDLEAERLNRKQRLAASLRIFGKFGFDEGVAGHITVRDPEDLEQPVVPGAALRIEEEGPGGVGRVGEGLDVLAQVVEDRGRGGVEREDAVELERQELLSKR